MASLTLAQIGTVAKGAGFTGDGLIWSIAVAAAESGGNPAAVGRNTDGSRDRGLWQINSKWHPEVTDAAAFNPAQAAAAAYRISGGGKNFKPWATYTNGSANGWLSKATTAAAQVNGSAKKPAAPAPAPDGNGTSKVSGVAGGQPPADLLGGLIPGELIQQLQTIANSFASFGSIGIKAAEWMATPRNWVRVMEVGGGLALVVIALLAMSKSGAGPVADAAAAPGKAKKAVAGLVGLAATKGKKAPAPKAAAPKAPAPKAPKGTP